MPTANDPFVQRFYDITPALNANAAQATVTLYFTQGEFDAYNTFATANPGLLLPLLPTNKVDNGNVRIKQFHGQFQSTSDPSVSITPTVVWDFPNGWWVVTFPVSGFSRFYLTTSNAVLPLTLLEFNGRLQQNAVNLQWLTTNEINVKEFAIERGNQSTTFSDIGKIPAASTGVTHQYSFTDTRPLPGNSFYRLRMIDKDGNFDYSNVITIKIADPLFNLSAYPNPAKNKLNVKTSSNGNSTITIQVNDLLGIVVWSKIISVNNGENVIPLDVSKLPAGSYFLRVSYADGKENVVKKFAKR